MTPRLTKFRLLACVTCTGAVVLGGTAAVAGQTRPPEHASATQSQPAGQQSSDRAGAVPNSGTAYNGLIATGLESFWRDSIRDAPLASNSAALAKNLNQQVKSRYNGNAAFNVGQDNIAVWTVPANTPKVTVKFDDCTGKGYVSPGLYTGPMHFEKVPIPTNAAAGRGTDQKLGIYQPSSDKLWEFWLAKKKNGHWQACWGGRIDNISKNNGQHQRPFGVSATGIAMAPGAISLKDMEKGRIDHAIFISLAEVESATKFSWPATRSDGWNPNNVPNRPMQGQRLRLDPRVNVDSLKLTPIAKMVAKAAQEYGFVIGDKGDAVAIMAESGHPYEAVTGKNPWVAKLNGVAPHHIFANFPWDKMQFLPRDYGKTGN